jgi:hypothetical protein
MAPSSSSRFLSFEHENRSHDAAQKAFMDALANGSLPKDGQNFHNAYHIVTDMQTDVGESVSGSGQRANTPVSSPFGGTVQSKVYSGTTNPVSTRFARTVFNIDGQGNVTRGQHFPTTPHDQPGSYYSRTSQGNSHIYGTRFGSERPPRADPGNVKFPW